MYKCRFACVGQPLKDTKKCTVLHCIAVDQSTLDHTIHTSWGCTDNYLGSRAAAYQYTLVKRALDGEGS